MRIQTRHRALTLLLLALLVATAAAAHTAEPAAVLIQLSGRVEVERAGRTSAAAVGTSLEPGDRLIVPAGGRAVLMYRTGRMETTTSSVTIADRASEQVGNVYRQTAQTIAQVATTDASRQPNRQGMIRPIPGEAVPIAPRNDIVVLDVRPTFSWFARPGAPSYIVQLRRTDVPGARPVRFDAGPDTVWRYPADEPALLPGAAYQWTVAAGLNARPAAEAGFRIAGSAEFERLAELFTELGTAGIDPAGDGLFVTALWYSAAGLVYEADHALRRLDAQGAGGRTFHLLRGEVYDRMGDLESASRAFRAADAESGS
jgi:hypothetical protein